MRKKYIISVIALVVLLAGCSQKDLEPYRDAPVSNRNEKPAEVYTMPDGFSNVAGKCDGHGHRIFVAFKGDKNRAAIAVIADQTC